MKVITVFGHSGAGKGTVATMLCMLDDRLHHSKFARPMKVELEQEYNLPEGFLEHRLVKSQRVNYNKPQTYIDVMVGLYHQRESMVQLPLSTQDLLQQCEDFGLVPVFDDCRNDREADTLAKYNTFGIWVNGRGNALTTDAKQWDYWMVCDYKNHLHNKGSHTDLMKSVTALYDSCIKHWLG